MKKTISECAELAGSHLATAFRAILSSSNPPGFQPLPSGGVLVITGIDHPMGNMLCGPGDSEIESGLAALVDCQKSSMVTFTTVHPNAKEKLAETLGFQFYPPTPTMAIDLENLVDAPLSQDYSFHQLEPGDSFDGWSAAASAGFQIPVEFCKLMCPLPNSAPPDGVFYFEIRQGDLVVAVSSMVCREGVAGVYCVATLPAHRGHGLGAYVTAEPLRLARDMGYRIGILQASKAGYPVYQRLGFETVGSIRMATRIPK